MVIKEKDYVVVDSFETYNILWFPISIEKHELEEITLQYYRFKSNDIKILENKEAPEYRNYFFNSPDLNSPIRIDKLEAHLKVNNLVYICCKVANEIDFSEKDTYELVADFDTDKNVTLSYRMLISKTKSNNIEFTIERINEIKPWLMLLGVASIIGLISILLFWNYYYNKDLYNPGIFKGEYIFGICGVLLGLLGLSLNKLKLFASAVTSEKGNLLNHLKNTPENFLRSDFIYNFRKPLVAVIAALLFLTISGSLFYFFLPVNLSFLPNNFYYYDSNNKKVVTNKQVYYWQLDNIKIIFNSSLSLRRGFGDAIPIGYVPKEYRLSYITDDDSASQEFYYFQESKENKRDSFQLNIFSGCNFKRRNELTNEGSLSDFQRKILHYIQNDSADILYDHDKRIFRQVNIDYVGNIKSKLDGIINKMSDLSRVDTLNLASISKFDDLLSDKDPNIDKIGDDFRVNDITSMFKIDSIFSSKMGAGRINEKYKYLTLKWMLLYENKHFSQYDVDTKLIDSLGQEFRKYYSNTGNNDWRIFLLYTRYLMFIEKKFTQNMDPELEGYLKSFKPSLEYSSIYLRECFRANRMDDARVDYFCKILKPWKNDQKIKNLLKDIGKMPLDWKQKDILKKIPSKLGIQIEA